MGDEVPANDDNPGYAYGVGGRWPTDLFGCFENIVPSCLMASFCFCFPLARVRASAGLQSPSFIGSNYNTNLVFLITLSVFWFLFMILTSVAPGAMGAFITIVGLVICLFLFITRREYRRSKQIEDNCCCCDDDIYDDFFSSFCCGCCVVAQLDRAEFGWAANQLSGCQESFAEPGDLEAPAA